MDYASYKQLRDALVQERHLLRLDCMNPVQALARWTYAELDRRQKGTGSLAQALATWSKATEVTLDPERTVVGRGVREMLSAVFQTIERDAELWLPEDVYPAYWELARHAAAKNTRGFVTLPRPDWSFLLQSAEHAITLLPVPLSPLGRLPTDAEIDLLSRWLTDSRHRLLIIDTVYTFDFGAARLLTDLLLAKSREQCIVLWSCSKSWLAPGCLGIAAVPSELAPALRAQIVPPTQGELGNITTTLEERPGFPLRQQEAFDREWERLAPSIRDAVPDWRPPASGYFSVASVPFTTLLDRHNILSVPASVFGSRHDDLSILTCLYSLADAT